MLFHGNNLKLAAAPSFISFDWLTRGNGVCHPKGVEVTRVVWMNSIQKNRKEFKDQGGKRNFLKNLQNKNQLRYCSVGLAMPTCVILW